MNFFAGTSTWYPTPTFQDTPVNVTVTEGKHAFLPCTVANLGDRSVSICFFSIIFATDQKKLYTIKIAVYFYQRKKC